MSSRDLRRLTLLAVGMGFAMLTAGSVVRLSGDGAACPDWPLCYNSVLPWGNAKALAETAHRALAALVLSLVAWLAIKAWRAERAHAATRALVSALILFAAQVGIGAVVSLDAANATWAVLHLLAGPLALGLLLRGALLLHLPDASADDASAAARAFRRALRALVVSLFVFLSLGAVVAVNGAELACGNALPLCNGGLLPNGGRLTFVQWLHRVSVLGVLLMLGRVLRVVLRRDVTLPRALRWSLYALLAAFLAQALFGAAMIRSNRAALFAALHNVSGYLVWLLAVAGMTLGQCLPLHVPQRPARPQPAWVMTVRDYLMLTKPKVVSLLLFTTLAGMFLTPAGPPPWYLVVWTMLGGYLMAGGANAINMAYDADIDRVMSRTAWRPTVAGRIPPWHAYAFGFVLMALALAIFVLFVNVLTAALALIGFLYYTVVYTRWLKRSTWQNIVIGGGAGAIPPLIGWAAASSQLSAPALLLFALVFYWTPPHFWALALLKQREYALAGVPMLPVVAGEKETARQMLWYALGTVAISLMLTPLGVAGEVYLVSALALGAWLLALTWRLNQTLDRATALQLYLYSLFYLFALFGAMVTDRALRWLTL